MKNEKYIFFEIKFVFRLATKYCGRPGEVELIPRQLEKAVRYSVYGRPGPCYIDLPGIISESVA